tara:strand:- start:275 stop:682 length:408 start_codon:yes stop_codon:yes gene_type:complete
MNLIAIVDSVGRVILGRHEEDKSDDNVISLLNPAVVNIQVNQESGQISVQLIPYIFREFVLEARREAGVSWQFQKGSITVSDTLELEPSIIDQYARIFEGAPAPEQPAQSEPVDLFDEAEIEDPVDESEDKSDDK